MINTSEEQSTQIIIDNNHTAQLISSKFNLKLINKLLSYQQEGAQYSSRFQNSGWNGITYLMSKTGKFPIGLIDKVKRHLEDNEVEVFIVDKRQKQIRNTPLDLTPIYTKLNKFPRDYQIQAVENVYNSSHNRNIIKVGTGGGKSLIGSMLLAKFNTTSIVHVINLDLLDQFYDELTLMFPDEKIGYIGNGKVIIGDRFNVASIWTTGQSLNLDKKTLMTDDENIDELPVSDQDKIKIVTLLKSANFHLFDECHVASCSTIQSISKNLIAPNLNIVGMSGSPFKSLGTGVDLVTTGILGSPVIDIDSSFLIEKGVLVQPTIIYRHVPHMTKLGSNYQEVYKNYIVENFERNKIIVNDTKKLLEKGHTVLVLFKNIKHGNILHDLFIEAGIDHELLSGKDNLDKRQIVKDKVTSGECKVILSSTIFDCGINLPVMSALISSAGKSYVKIIQRVGRVIRGYTSPDGIKKTNAIVIEFMDNAKYLKQHSLKRYEIYKTEPKFNIKTCESMKKFI